MRACLTTLFLTAALALAPASRAADAPAAGWELAGRLGLVHYVIVPVATARDRALYDRAIEQLCAGRGTCFVRFFTNTSGAPVGLPLPDAISDEATVIYQRSDKRGGGGDFRWSCRLKIPGSDCF